MKQVEQLDKICGPAAAGLVGGVTYLMMESAPNLRIGRNEYPTSLVVVAAGIAILIVCANSALTPSQTREISR